MRQKPYHIQFSDQTALKHFSGLPILALFSIFRCVLPPLGPASDAFGTSVCLTCKLSQIRHDPKSQRLFFQSCINLCCISFPLQPLLAANHLLPGQDELEYSWLWLTACWWRNRPRCMLQVTLNLLLPYKERSTLSWFHLDFDLIWSFLYLSFWLFECDACL